MASVAEDWAGVLVASAEKINCFDQVVQVVTAFKDLLCCFWIGLSSSAELTRIWLGLISMPLLTNWTSSS